MLEIVVITWENCTWRGLETNSQAFSQDFNFFCLAVKVFLVNFLSQLQWPRSWLISRRRQEKNVGPGDVSEVKASHGKITWSDSKYTQWRHKALDQSESMEFLLNFSRRSLKFGCALSWKRVKIKVYEVIAITLHATKHLNWDGIWKEESLSSGSLLR